MLAAPQPPRFTLSPMNTVTPLAYTITGQLHKRRSASRQPARFGVNADTDAPPEKISDRVALVNIPPTYLLPA